MKLKDAALKMMNENQKPGEMEKMGKVACKLRDGENEWEMAYMVGEESITMVMGTLRIKLQLVWIQSLLPATYVATFN